MAAYPQDWPAISRAIRFGRAKGRCECRGECGAYHGDKPGFRARCRARHGKAHPTTGSCVTLQCAHLDHDEANCVPENLRAMCERCHLRYDKNEHIRRRRERERAGRVWRELFD